MGDDRKMYNNKCDKACNKVKFSLYLMREWMYKSIFSCLGTSLR
jgi:hypothetical protein